MARDLIELSEAYIKSQSSDPQNPISELSNQHPDEQTPKSEWMRALFSGLSIQGVDITVTGEGDARQVTITRDDGQTITKTIQETDQMERDEAALTAFIYKWLFGYESRAQAPAKIRFLVEHGLQSGVGFNGTNYQKRAFQEEFGIDLHAESTSIRYTITTEPDVTLRAETSCNAIVNPYSPDLKRELPDQKSIKSIVTYRIEDKWWWRKPVAVCTSFQDNRASLSYDIHRLAILNLAEQQGHGVEKLRHLHGLAPFITQSTRHNFSFDPELRQAIAKIIRDLKAINNPQLKEHLAYMEAVFEKPESLDIKKANELKNNPDTYQDRSLPSVEGFAALLGKKTCQSEAMQSGRPIQDGEQARPRGFARTNVQNQSGKIIYTSGDSDADVHTISEQLATAGVAESICKYVKSYLVHGLAMPSFSYFTYLFVQNENEAVLRKTEEFYNLIAKTKSPHPHQQFFTFTIVDPSHVQLTLLRQDFAETLDGKVVDHFSVDFSVTLKATPNNSDLESVDVIAESFYAQPPAFTLVKKILSQQALTEQDKADIKQVISPFYSLSTDNTGTTYLNCRMESATETQLILIAKYGFSKTSRERALQKLLQKNPVLDVLKNGNGSQEGYFLMLSEYPAWNRKNLLLALDNPYTYGSTLVNLAQNPNDPVGVRAFLDGITATKPWRLFSSAETKLRYQTASDIKSVLDIIEDFKAQKPIAETLDKISALSLRNRRTLAKSLTPDIFRNTSHTDFITALFTEPTTAAEKTMLKELLFRSVPNLQTESTTTEIDRRILDSADLKAYREGSSQDFVWNTNEPGLAVISKVDTTGATLVQMIRDSRKPDAIPNFWERNFGYFFGTPAENQNQLRDKLKAGLDNLAIPDVAEILETADFLSQSSITESELYQTRFNQAYSRLKFQLKAHHTNIKTDPTSALKPLLTLTRASTPAELKAKVFALIRDLASLSVPTEKADSKMGLTSTRIELLKTIFSDKRLLDLMFRYKEEELVKIIKNPSSLLWTDQSLLDIVLQRTDEHKEKFPEFNNPANRKIMISLKRSLPTLSDRILADSTGNTLADVVELAVKKPRAATNPGNVFEQREIKDEDAEIDNAKKVLSELPEENLSQIVQTAPRNVRQKIQDRLQDPSSSYYKKITGALRQAEAKLPGTGNSDTFGNLKHEIAGSTQLFPHTPEGDKSSTSNSNLTETSSSVKRDLFRAKGDPVTSSLVH